MSVNTTYKQKKILTTLSGATISIAITLVLILLFAVLIRFLNIPDSFIFPVNQVIKIISLIIGIVFVLKKDNNKGFLKGILIGTFYFIISYIVFSILQGKFSIEMNNLLDLILTSFMGGLIGIIFVNILKK